MVAVIKINIVTGISRYQYSSPSIQSVDARIGVLNDGLRNCQMCDDVYD